MFEIFKKKILIAETPMSADWSFLGADMHSHLLPGIDDGVKSMEESLGIIRQLQETGFRKLITTPHINEDFYPNKKEDILRARDMVQKEARTAGIDIELEAAAEYMIDSGFMQLLEGKETLLTLPGNYVLVEMGFIQETPLLLKALFEAQAKGYLPVLAHPERYAFYHDQPLDVLEKLKENGCFLQLNTIALSGYYGKHVKAQAERILKENLYDFCGTDIHHQRHVQALQSTGGAYLQSLESVSFLNKGL